MVTLVLHLYDLNLCPHLWNETQARPNKRKIIGCLLKREAHQTQASSKAQTQQAQRQKTQIEMAHYLSHLG